MIYDYDKVRGKTKEKFKTQGGFSQVIRMSTASVSLTTKGSGRNKK